MAHRDYKSHKANLQHLKKYDSGFRRKRKRLLGALTFRGFLNCIELGIIIPSAWSYLKAFNSSTWLYAVLMSTAKIACFLTSPVIGRIYDKTKRIREIILVLNTLEIIGSLLYSLPFSIWFLLIGRFISGIGIASLGIRNSETAWITTEEERLAEYSKQLICMMLGLLLGPALSFLFKDIRIETGSWKIDFRNAPGVFCALVWLGMQVLSLFLITNVAKEYVDVENGKVGLLEEDGESENVNTSKLSISAERTRKSYEDEQDNHLQNENGHDQETEKEPDAVPSRGIVREMFAPDILILFLTKFLSYGYLVSSEVTIPLFTQEDLKWNTVETASLYVGAALLATLILAVLSKYGKQLSEIRCIMVANFMGVGSLALVACYQYKRKDQNVASVILCTAVAVGILNYSVNSVAGKSLLSKVIPVREQGVMQGVYASFGMLGGIAGPIFGGFMFNHIYVSISVFCLLFIGLEVWIALCANKLEIRKSLYYGNRKGVDKSGNYLQR